MKFYEFEILKVTFQDIDFRVLATKHRIPNAPETRSGTTIINIQRPQLSSKLPPNKEALS